MEHHRDQHTLYRSLLAGERVGSREFEEMISGGNLTDLINGTDINIQEAQTPSRMNSERPTLRPTII